jgi:hypothetical protein
VTPTSVAIRLLAILLAVGIAACAEARDPFDRRMTFDRIERSFRDQGLHLCSKVERNGDANQAVASRQYRLALDCATTDDAAVTVDQFTEAEDRDAAARNFEVQTRPPAGGAVYTLGPFAVVILPATTDNNIFKLSNVALKKLSAD